jgi:site-specific DNA recombinase
MIREPKYAGRLEYGRRTSQIRELIASSVPRLVSNELWQSAQDALERNRRVTRNSPRRYLLKRVITCGICGLTYSGSQGRTGVAWYRCNGQLAERGPIAGKCWGHSIRADALEPVVWADLERFLRDPGDVLDELDAPAERDAHGAIAEAERTLLARLLERLAIERLGLIRQAARGWLSDEALDAELTRVDAQRGELERRVAAVAAPPPAAVDELAQTLLDEVRARLDAGLSDEQRQEIVRLLVGIRIDTQLPTDGAKKSARAIVEYRLPGVVETSTGTGSSRRQQHLGIDPNSPQHDLK